MEYKIWIATYLNSPPPYPIELTAEKIERNACIWKTEETVWRHIGTVDSLEAARYMVENDRGAYRDADGICYYLECEPSDELFYSLLCPSLVIILIASTSQARSCSPVRSS